MSSSTSSSGESSEWKSGKGSTTQSPVFKLGRASTSNEIENLYRHINSEIGAVRSEMKGEIATVMAAVKESEAQRSADYRMLEASIKQAEASLPSKDSIRNYILAGFGAVIATLAFFWAVLDTGANVTGAFADDIMANKEQDSRIERKLDELLQDNGQSKASNSQR